MSKQSARRRAARDKEPAATPVPARPLGDKSWTTRDSFTNFTNMTGYGAGSQQDGAGYAFDMISRNRIQIEAAYRSNWVCGMAVDSVAQDMTRAGIEIQSTMPPEDIEVFQKGIENLNIWSALQDTIKWARLYGGCIAVMLIDGQKPETPLRTDTIRPGQFKGLLVLDRWVIQPSLQDLITDFGPDLGKPKFYTVIADAQALVNMKIHHTRVIRLDGLPLPYWQRIAENGWGNSVLERVWDRIIAFDSTTEGAAQLVYKAYLRTYKIDGLRDIIAIGGKALEGLVKQIEMIRNYQSNEGMTLMDAKDEFEGHSYTFAGLSDTLLAFAQQISGALQIPLVRLFGQSPAGLNSTGESDLRMYYDNVNAQQNGILRPGLMKLFEVMSLSILKKPLPDDFAFEFTSLWQLDDTEKATIAGSVATSVSTLESNGIIDRATALKELRQSSRTTGIFSNITDEQIEEAENEPPAPTELSADPDGGDPEEVPGAQEEEPA